MNLLALIVCYKKVNKTHEIIKQKNTPPFFPPTENSNKMIEIIYISETMDVHRLIKKIMGWNVHL